MPKFLAPIDLSKSEIRNAVIQNLASPPGSPVEGQVYYDTAAHKFQGRTNSAWVDMQGGGSVSSVDVSGISSFITTSGGPVTGSGTIALALASQSQNLVYASPSGSSGTPTFRTIVNADVSGSAAIVYSKLSLGNAIVNADIATGAAIAYSKLALGTSIVNADISTSAAIAYSKLNLGTSIVNADISASAAIAYSKLALTGSVVNGDIVTVAGSKVTGTVAAANLPSIDAIATATATAADVSLNSHKLTNVTDPSSAQDAATKAYVDAARTGLDVKASVRVATTSAGTLASSFENGDAVDGVTLATGDRILVKDQSSGAENGIYTVNASGAPTRATDADANAEVTGGLFTFVEEGTTNADTGWLMSNNGAVTVGTTALTFVQFSAAGQVAAGAGLTRTGNTLDVVTASSARIVVAADSIDLATVGTAGTYTSVTTDAYGRVSAGADIITSNGMVARTASGTFAARTVTGTTNLITVTNGDGVSGNPTLTVGSNVYTSGGTDVAVADGGTGASTAAAGRANLGASGIYSAAGSGTAATFAITQATHGLGTSGNSYCDIEPAVWDKSANPAVRVFPDVSVSTSTGDITFTFAASQTLSNFQFNVIGK